ncbi:hypothetical protein CASFOL_019482 [Castilleja foliolosa]|uniref:Hexosyltransferase n=1 Tax=Castilleja foliolosa TaxID=1961234 RepID=A0ABD3D4G6_9LAMI
MASTFSKLKHYVFPFIILSIALLFLITNYLFFTINYTRQLQDEFQNMNTYLTRFHSREWFDIIPQDINDEKLKIGSLEMERVRDKLHIHTKQNVANFKNPEWYEIVAREFRDETFNVGLVNMGRKTDNVRTTAKIVNVDFNRAAEGVRWADLAPERIDENSTCPSIPMPRFEDYRDLDVVVASIDRCESKDVFRLQVNLVVANLLVRSGRKDGQPVYAVFVGGCHPMSEIFRCDDLLWKVGNSWVYKPQLTRIQKLMLMPFGPCQFVPPFSNSGDQNLWTKLNHITTQSNHKNPKHAYVTVLHTSEDYVCGAIVLAQSILQSNTTKDLILLADDNISLTSLEALRSAGWQTKLIERIRSPYSKQNTYNEWNYSKLRIWELTQYEKLMFIDSDLLVNMNIDKLFVYPELTAASNYQKHFFNSGLMIVEPSRCTFETLMEKMVVVESYNGGDQGFLNEIFAWWHRLPATTNYLKVFVDVNDHLHYVDRKNVLAVHYTGLKPWKCEDEESDCNWDVLEFHRYASNSAHKMWWKVYKSMPKDLRDYCSLYRAKNNDAYSPNEGHHDISIVN